MTPQKELLWLTLSFSYKRMLKWHGRRQNAAFCKLHRYKDSEMNNLQIRLTMANSKFFSYFQMLMWNDISFLNFHFCKQITNKVFKEWKNTLYSPDFEMSSPHQLSYLQDSPYVSMTDSI